jgi:hypothetical protein
LDSDITLLADVEALKLLIDSGIWAEVPAALAIVGETLELGCLMGNSNEETPQKPMNPNDPFRSAMAIHSLFLGVIHYTQVGAARQAASTLGHLHALLDEGVLDKFPDGFITVSNLLNMFSPLTAGDRLVLSMVPNCVLSSRTRKRSYF